MSQYSDRFLREHAKYTEFLENTAGESADFLLVTTGCL